MSEAMVKLSDAWFPESLGREKMSIAMVRGVPGVIAPATEAVLSKQLGDWKGRPENVTGLVMPLNEPSCMLKVNVCACPVWVLVSVAVQLPVTSGDMFEPQPTTSRATASSKADLVIILIFVSVFLA